MSEGEPHIRVTWDEAQSKIKHAEVITLKEGEDRIVARRLKQELSGTA